MPTVEPQLPPAEEMYTALCARDPEYLGVFIACVRTTGIFCVPTCRARKPRRENVEFVATAAEALRGGFRPCKVCRPIEPPEREPAWVRELVAQVSARPDERVTDADLRARGLDPGTVRRWFQRRHGVTFHGWQRAWRVGAALGELRSGSSALEAGVGSGFASTSGFREAFHKLFGAPPSAADASNALVARWLETPLGPMVAIASDTGLALLEFTDRRALENQVAALRKRRMDIVPGTNVHLDRTAAQLAEYFAGERRAFDLELDLAGSPFQEQVWRGLLEIEAGETLSYAELAARIGRPGAARAVGRANGLNRIAIVVPCHRVVGADGSPTGYGGGVWRKVRLLELEAATPRSAAPSPRS